MVMVAWRAKRHGQSRKSVMTHIPRVGPLVPRGDPRDSLTLRKSGENLVMTYAARKSSRVMGHERTLN